MTAETLLTDRERDVLEAYGELGNIRLVAEVMGTTYNTVRNQLYSARQKLGVRFTVEAVWMARGLPGVSDGTANDRRTT